MMMFLHKYRAYGLRIHAEMECPELLEDPESSSDHDVMIRMQPPAPMIEEALEHGYFEVGAEVFRLAIAGVARYLVEQGNSITITPLEGASLEEIRLFLLGSAMGALLYQRGLFPLHGSAVETRWGAMIFVGAQGVGKSTLASEFHKQGYRLLSDDVCALSISGDQVFVLPALAHMRLCADAYERLGQSENGRFHVDKFVVPLHDSYCDRALPLRAIHLLTDSEQEDPKFAPFQGFDRIQRLLENLYRPEYLQGQSTQGDLMRTAGQIAQRSTMALVSRKRDTAAIEHLVPFLESAWSDQFKAARIGA